MDKRTCGMLLPGTYAQIKPLVSVTGTYHLTAEFQLVSNKTTAIRYLNVMVVVLDEWSRKSSKDNYR